MDFYIIKLNTYVVYNVTLMLMNEVNYFLKLCVYYKCINVCLISIKIKTELFSNLFFFYWTPVVLWFDSVDLALRPYPIELLPYPIIKFILFELADVILCMQF